MKLLLRLSVILLVFNVSAQDQYILEDFGGIYCEGDVPRDFLSSTSSLYQDDVQLKAHHQDKDSRKHQKAFFLSSNFFLHQLMLSGQVSFGDPISIYLNEIKDRLLVNYPHLQHEIRIYLIKSPLVNAFANDSGVLFITTALVARCKSESELAFVIAHESAHYELKHMIKGFLENQLILEQRGSYLKMNWVQIQKAIFYRSQRKEFEADSLGKDFICNSPYNAEEGITGTFDLLHQSYLPFEQREYKRGFMQNYNCNIPACFYLDKVKTISKEEDYFDKTHSHPNIHKRREKLTRTFEACTPTTTVQIDEKFDRIVLLAQFETVRQEVLSRSYGDAIFHSYLLLQKHPENKFLELCIGKSLYGLTRYKIRRKFSLAAESSSGIEGESQQIHFMLKQFTKEQLASITLKYLWFLKSKYPQDQSITPLIKGVIGDMVIHLDLTPDMFKSSEFKPTYKISAEELEKLDFRKRTRTEQKAHRDFYLHLFIEEKENDDFVNHFEYFYDTRDSIRFFNDLNFKNREELNENKIKRREKYGLGLGINKIILLDP